MKQVERREFLKTSGSIALSGLPLRLAAARGGLGGSDDLSDSARKIVQEHLATVENHLNNGIIPFWFARALDTQYGGFMTNFDGQGKALPVPEKYVNTQCRLIWWFSTLHRRFPQMPKAMDMASQGADFLIKNFWDQEYGGFYWKVKRDGSGLDSAKIVYGKSFCIYALSEYLCLLKISFELKSLLLSASVATLAGSHV